jgi:translation initiation factor 5A
MAELRNLKEGNYIVIDGEPCKIISLTKGKTSKHGEAKGRVEAIGVFDGKKRQLVKPVTANIEVPIILKKKGQVVSVQGNIAQIMDLESYEMIDFNIPEGMELKEGDEINYIEWEGRRKIVER